MTSLSRNSQIIPQILRRTLLYVSRQESLRPSKLLHTSEIAVQKEQKHGKREVNRERCGIATAYGVS